jgi:hypothetical protein
MATKALTKEQKKAARQEERSRRAARMKRELGETISRKVGLLAAGYGAGIAPAMGPVRTHTAMAVAGWGGALLIGGKVGSALEGIGDAGGALYAQGMGAAKRATLARDHFLRGEFFEASGDAPAAPAVRAAERRAFAAGRVSGLRDGARGAVGALRDAGVADDDDNEAAGIPSSASELVQGQVAEVMDGQ